MDLKQIQYFISVVEMRSFSKAATALHIAQPAISRQIKALEDELGLQLLHRDGRGVMPTEEGKEFALRAGRIVQDIRQLKADMVGRRGEPTGELLLGLPPVIGADFIASLVREFRRRYANATLRVVEGFSYQIVDWLQMGRLDLGIIYDPDYYRNISTKPLVSQNLYLAGRWDKISTVPPTCRFAEAVRLPLIMPVQPNSLSKRINDIATANGLRVNLQLEVDSIYAIRKLVAQGEGYTIIPYAAILADVERGDLFASRIVEPPIFRPLAIAFPNRGVQTLLTTRLVELIEEHVRDLLAVGDRGKT